MLELLRTSREASSVEFVLVNDGSDHDTSVVDAAAKTMTKHFGILVTWVRGGCPGLCVAVRAPRATEMTF